MKTKVKRNPGSFRDPANQIYEIKNTTLPPSGSRILRGVNREALANFQKLSSEKFYHSLLQNKQVVHSEIINSSDDAEIEAILSDGWVGILEHPAIPFITYPYEWSFSMLKDAALLHLNILEKSLRNGWILKDSSPYNIQWQSSKPVFIDLPSFCPWIEGDPWVGYRQFCAMFFTPLAIKKHLDIDYRPLLRSCLDGIPPVEASKYFTGLNRFKKGILSHIIFPAKVENMIVNRERDNAPAQTRTGQKQSEAMVLGLVQSMGRLINKLSIKNKHSDWSKYEKTHSYSSEDIDTKKDFIKKHASTKRHDHIWDIGCNTGTFSKVCSPFCNQVIAIDGDQDAIEQLYLSEKQQNNSNILPLVINLANISPNQGWGSTERSAFDSRKKPDLVLCLALIHHLRISANIPNRLLLEWLRSLNSNVIIEFVYRNDEMVEKLLTNKKERYADYNLNQFIEETQVLFDIKGRMTLKGNKRELFFLTPK